MIKIGIHIEFLCLVIKIGIHIEFLCLVIKIGIHIEFLCLVKVHEITVVANIFY